jgi:putative endonuclease
LSAVPGIHVLHHPSVLGGYVYILASSPNGILYIAGDERSCAANLRASEWLVAGFTKKYSVKRLVYFEHHETIQAAIQREHNMKHWSRKWKVRLVRANNPERNDLYETIV